MGYYAIYTLMKEVNSDEKGHPSYTVQDNHYLPLR